MKIGIDRLSFFIPNLYLDVTELAESRGDDPAKRHIEIDQGQMTVNHANEDIIALGANAVNKIVTEKDRGLIDMVIVGTESGIGHSKASVVIIHYLLRIQSFARSFEVKEACYDGTATLHMAKEYVKNHPERKVLIVASDIARYDLTSGDEVTQGVGAIAMMITQNPHILSIEDGSIFLTGDICDFWRPNYSEFPVVDSPLSNSAYIEPFQRIWNRHRELSGRGLEDHQAIAFHIPYTKMGKKALQGVLDQTDEENQERLMARYEESIRYSRRVGNLYTGSLYLGLTSLLGSSKSLQPGDRIDLFSYGSGAVSEFFTGYLEENYQEYLFAQSHQEMLDSQARVTVGEHETIFSETFPEHGKCAECTSDVPFSITEIENGIRCYRI